MIFLVLLPSQNRAMRTLFMDRDGVVNVQIIGGYVMKYSQFVFHDGLFEALHQLRTHFDRILLVTNQQCVGKGMCDMATINLVHEQMQQQLQKEGIAFDKIYCCPHLATAECNCRKPKIGMAMQAKVDFPDIDFSKSVMVGDSLSDIQFGMNAGMLPIHVGAVRYPEFERIQQLTPYHYDSVLDFVNNFKFQPVDL